jgi:hypothetical protein
MMNVMYHKRHNYTEMSLKTQYEQKLMLLSGDVKNNVFNMTESMGTFGVSVLEEAVLVRILGDERRFDGDRLAEIFEEKCRHTGHNAKKFGYGILHRKKFHDFVTLHETYTYFVENKLLRSRAWVGITENITGRFLFFNQANKIDKWLQHCVDGYKKSLEDVMGILSYTQQSTGGDTAVVTLSQAH